MGRVSATADTSTAIATQGCLIPVNEHGSAIESHGFAIHGYCAGRQHQITIIGQ